MEVMYYKRIFFIAVILSLLISGCVSTPPQEVTPVPTATSIPAVTPAMPGTDVEVLKAPAAADTGRSFEISWRVNSPVEKNITHTAVHYGPEPKSEPLTLQSYPELTVPYRGMIPADFSANITINRTGTIYFRAHAIIDGNNYWSSEKTVSVSAPVTEPETSAIRLVSYPSGVDGETNFSIQWDVSGGTSGDINNTAIIWGFKTGSANISDYLRTSPGQTGKTPQRFSAELKAPASGTIYFRAYANVDGADIYSEQHLITIISPYTGAGGGGGGY